MVSLSPVEQEIVITLLLRGDCLPVTVADDHDRHPSSVSRSLSALESRGIVAEKDRAVYTLTVSGFRIARSLLRSSRSG